LRIDTARWRHIAPSKSPTGSEAVEKWIKHAEADDPERPVTQYRQHLVHQPQGARRAELSPKVVQQLLGHSSTVMILDRYGHLFPRGDDRAELTASARALLG
jgi:integrase